jgi:membrane protease YdiL (CAAX protease family)
LVTVIIAFIIVFINQTFKTVTDYEALMKTSSWIFSVLVHIPQFLIPFLLICFMTKGRPGKYGFNLRQKPPVFTHRRMLGLGVLFGLLISLKYVPQIVNRMPIDIPQPVTLPNVLGTMTFQWIIVGLSEETLFRGLIQTYLMNHLRGNVQVFGHELHSGTVIAAIIWGAFHFINILVMPLGRVVFFVLLTTVAVMGMGYAYQETRSLLTTIIIHNTIFGVPLTIGYILYWVL